MKNRKWLWWIVVGMVVIAFLGLLGIRIEIYG